MGELLRSCQLHAAFALDPSFRPLRRPSMASALGLVSHDMAEAVARGELDGVDAASLDEALECEWEARIESRYSDEALEVLIKAKGLAAGS